VFCLAARLTVDRQRREDWTHSTLLGILDDLRCGRFAYRRPGSFWAWFRKRAYFRLLDEYRRERRHEAREVTVDPDAGGPDLSEFGGGSDPGIEIERVELVAAVDACIERIPSPDQRRALILLLRQDLSYEDVAATLVAPLNTVRAWIRRGRILLRACLAERLGLGVGTADV
jgi:RNA polymerase sigma factor (sigma-70 family)